MSSLWSHEQEIDGASYRVNDLGLIVGLGRILVVDGLPDAFVEDLVKSSQVVEAPHSWRVRQVDSVAEVTPDDIENGRAAVAEDLANFGTHIISYYLVDEGSMEFVAAGAIRNKLNRNYESNRFPVVSRAVVHPKHRGKGLGNLIVDHRLSLVMDFFGEKPNAIHFATEAPQILTAARKFSDKSGIPFIHLGTEVLDVNGLSNQVEDYLFVLPAYRKLLLKESSGLGLPPDFRDRMRMFLSSGIEATSGDRLASDVAAALKLGSRNLDLLTEFFDVRKNIGASDSVPAKT